MDASKPELRDGDRTVRAWTKVEGEASARRARTLKWSVSTTPSMDSVTRLGPVVWCAS